jgi:phospholipid transport system substrate-binding protein
MAQTRVQAIPLPDTRARQSLLLTALLALCLACALFSSPQASAQADGSPTAAVKTVIDSILAILSKPDFNVERDKAAVSALVQNGFDAQAMAQSVLSTNWRNATPEQRVEFRDLLVKTIEGTYLDRIDVYSNEEVEYRNEQISNDRASVDTLILAADKKIPVTYKLRKRSDGWFVYDIEVENVSMVSTYRETYRSVVSRDGLDGLLEQMRAKLAALSSAPPAL